MKVRRRRFGTRVDSGQALAKWDKWTGKAASRTEGWPRRRNRADWNR